MSLELDACTRESLWNSPEVNKLGEHAKYLCLVFCGMGFFIICLDLLSWFDCGGFCLFICLVIRIELDEQIEKHAVTYVVAIRSSFTGDVGHAPLSCSACCVCSS